MIELPLNEFWLPILGAFGGVYVLYRYWKYKQITGKEKWEAIIAVLVLLFSLNDNCNNSKKETTHSLKEDSLHRKIDTLRMAINSLQDTLQSSRDTLLKAGLKIDERTKRIEVVDEKIFSGIQKLLGQQTDTSIPDSLNYATSLHHDTILVHPQQGTWAAFYLYVDTNYITLNEIGSFILSYHNASDGHTITVYGKKIPAYKAFNFMNAVKSSDPLMLRVIKKPVEFYFGDGASLTKRYFYKNGKVKWIPER